MFLYVIIFVKQFVHNEPRRKRYIVNYVAHHLSTDKKIWAQFQGVTTSQVCMGMGAGKEGGGEHRGFFAIRIYMKEYVYIYIARRRVNSYPGLRGTLPLYNVCLPREANSKKE